MIYKYKSIKSIIAKLYRDLGTNTEINEGDVIEWISEAMARIGAYSQYVDKSIVLEVTNYRVMLPCDFVYPIDIAHEGRPLAWQGKSMINNYQCDECNQIPKCCTDHTFYIQDNYINTSFEEGDLCLVYQAVMTDDEGYPMVPDNTYFDEALSSYCTFKLDRIEYRKGKLPKDIYKDSERDWLFYVNSARGAANMPDLAKLERLKNVWVRLLPLTNEYGKFFSNNSNGERKYLQ